MFPWCHANCLQMKQFARNVNSCYLEIFFSGKIRKVCWFWSSMLSVTSKCLTHPSRHTTLKWRRINVDATRSRRIDVDTTSFWCCVPAGVCSLLLSKRSTHHFSRLLIKPIIAHCSPFSFEFYFKSAFIFFSSLWSIGQTVLHWQNNNKYW